MDITKKKEETTALELYIIVNKTRNYTIYELAHMLFGELTFSINEKLVIIMQTETV